MTITVPLMEKRGRFRNASRGWMVTVAVMVLGATTLNMVTACGILPGQTVGSAQRGPSPSPGGAPGLGPPASGTSITSTHSVEQGSGGAASGSVPPSPAPVPDAPSGGESAPVPGVTWTADVLLTGGAGDIVSPTGDLTAVVNHRGVCLHAGRPDEPGPDAGTGTGVGQCVLTFPSGVTPMFAVFSPTGAHLLVVAGPATKSAVYVIDARTWAVQIIGPQGTTPVGPSPPSWNLSSAAWDIDGAAVLLVPRTADETGAVLDIELAGGPPYERVRLAAELANSSPSLWSTEAGLVLVANAGGQRNKLWWADFATGAAQAIAAFGDTEGSLALSAADPLGRTVLVCPRRADGALGATIGVAVAGRTSAPLRPDSPGCAGVVFSADGKYLALADRLAAGYALTVVEAATGGTVLTVPLPVPVPASPPYLTWAGDVIVVSDVSGQWPLPAAVVRVVR